MQYHPPRGLGLLVGIVLTLWSVAVAVLLANEATATDDGVLAFLTYAGAVVAVALALIFAFWTYALATLTYSLDRNGLVIRWGPVRQVVPLEAIERLVPASAVGVPSVRGVRWWGHHVGRGSLAQMGSVLFYSTHQSADQVLYVMTSERNYAISVEDPAAFAQEVQRRQDLGPIAPVEHRVERAGGAIETFWADPRARWLAAAAVLGVVFVWGQVALRYGSLPETLALHFPPSRADSVVGVTGRETILELPRTATVLLVLNLVAGVVLHAWDRMAGYVLFAAAVVVQIGFFTAIALALA